TRRGHGDRSATRGYDRIRFERVASVPLGGRRQYWSAEVPVPGIATDARARVLERLELQPVGRDSDQTPVSEKTLSVSRYEMSERASLPHMAVQPETALHRVDHAFST